MGQLRLVQGAWEGGVAPVAACTLGGHGGAGSMCPWICKGVLAGTALQAGGRGAGRGLH